MTKVITSPVDTFPGSVTLYDPIGIKAVLAFQRASKESWKLDDTEALEKISLYLPALFQCVEKWDIKGIPPEKQNVDDFPFSPLAPAVRLASWLINEINEILFPKADDPNA